MRKMKFENLMKYVPTALPNQLEYNLVVPQDLTRELPIAVDSQTGYIHIQLGVSDL